MTMNQDEVLIARDPDIEEISNKFFIHPLSDWLATRLAPKNIHPNWVSFAGLFCGIIASYCYFQSPLPSAITWGFFFMILWHIFDGADGHLARLTNKASAIGKVIDGIADYSVFGAVYISLTILSFNSMGNMALYLLGGAILSHILQSATYERQREIYRLWVHGLSDNKEASEKQEKTGLFTLLASLLNRVYMAIQNILIKPEMANEQLMRLVSLPPKTQIAIREEYRQRFSPQIQLWTLLSANLHTFALFLFTLFGNPWSYFQFEIIGLNILLLALMLHQRRMDSNFIRWMNDQITHKKG